MSTLIKLIPKEFGKKECAAQTAATINLYANKISSKSYMQYKFHGIREVGLKPLKFISTLINLYNNLESIPSILEEIVADERSYSKLILIDIGSTAHKKNLMNENSLKKFEEVILQLESIEEIQKNLKTIIGEDYPDEFECQLTYELMTDPIKLYPTGNIVNRKAIEKHIALNGKNNPFNRQSLTDKDIVPQVELKARIDAFMKEKMEIYRAKYGMKKNSKIGSLLTSNHDVYNEENNDEDDDDETNEFYKPLL